MTMFGKGWAMPVVSKRWAFAASVLQWVKQATNYRWSWPNHAFGYAFGRAVGSC